MNAIELPAKAKINLTLDVLSKREDGYHEVKMLMQTIELCDLVRIEKNTLESSVSSNLRYLPSDRRNIAFKALEAFFAHTGIGSRASVFLEKRIPVAAGLAGGSADAAAVLKGLNALYETGLSEGELSSLGLSLGADVPYCLMGGTALAEGIGERLTPLDPLPPCYCVVCKPRFSVSTARIYEKIDRASLRSRPDTAGAIEAIRNRDLVGLGLRMYNVMEAVTAADHREIVAIKETLLTHGAIGAVMSGSGPSTYGLFTEKPAAEKACRALGRSYRDTFLAPVSAAPKE